MKTVEIIHHVEIDFYFISVEIFKIEIFWSRFIFVEIFIKIVEKNRDCRDKSRQIEIIVRNRDFVEKNRDFFLYSRSRLYGDQEILEKYAKITEISICLEKSRSRLKNTVLADLIETKSRNLDLDLDFSIAETNFWKPSRLSITTRLILFWRRDRESRSRPRRDKSRPPSLVLPNSLFTSI